jgi:uncharacterized membrane protein
MELMIIGLALWWATHLFPIYLPGPRAAAIARLGAGTYKGLFALLSLLAVALMVVGYRQADFVNVWYPPAWTIHLNNLLMLIAVLLLGARDMKSSVRHHIRHPMLGGVMVWAFAHLLVNGDAASVLLFSGLLAWAVVAVIGSNARDGAWVRPPKGDRRGLLIHLAATVVVFAVIAGVHGWLIGVYPFPR